MTVPRPHIIERSWRKPSNWKSLGLDLYLCLVKTLWSLTFKLNSTFVPRSQTTIMRLSLGAVSGGCSQIRPKTTSTDGLIDLQNTEMQIDIAPKVFRMRTTQLSTCSLLKHFIMMWIKTFFTCSAFYVKDLPIKTQVQGELDQLVFVMNLTHVINFCRDTFAHLES